MEILTKPPQKYLINAFLLFFVIHSIQCGVGLQGFQRVIYQSAQHDAWISVIISGLVTNIVVFVIIKTLSIYESTDLYGIHYDLYGSFLSKIINSIYIFYCLMSFLVIIRNYIEVVQAWIFPEIPVWFLSMTLLILVIYGTTAGIRTIVGVAFFSTVLSLWLILFLIYPIHYAHLDYLFPIFEADITDILKGAYNMTFTILGYEIIYTIYPFIKEKNKAQKFAQLGLLFTTFLYFFVMFVSNCSF